MDRILSINGRGLLSGRSLHHEQTLLRKCGDVGGLMFQRFFDSNRQRGCWLSGGNWGDLRAVGCLRSGTPLGMRLILSFAKDGRDDKW